MDLDLRTGANNSIEVNDEGQIKLRPLTAGLTTLGATNTYPGAAVSIQCTGVGAGTGAIFTNMVYMWMPQHHQMMLL